MMLLMYLTSALMVAFALVLVSSNQPVKSVLCLVGCFLCATIHWIILEAEFLALALIFVYVGAVMTLFLFMVMMLNKDYYPQEYQLGLSTVAGLICVTVGLPAYGFYWWDVSRGYNAWQTVPMPAYPENYDNTQALGLVMYTDYVYPFMLVAMLLLLAIVIAVAWVHRAKRDFVRLQRVTDQMAVTKASRLTLVDK